MIKLLTIIGARPQFIKAAALSHHLTQVDEIEEVLLHTGQHFDEKMSAVFFDELHIPKPKYNLGINSMSHGAMTGHMLIEIEKALLEEKPDMVLVYGDTNSTLAGALAAQKLHIPVAHVEAGLRSFNMKMPEEANRILTDRLSSILFCPTDQARDNLQTEGYNGFPTRVEVVGDIMLDTSLLFANLLETKSFDHLPDKDFILLTMHRAENTDDPEILKTLTENINRLAQKYPIVFPIHPRTKAKLKQYDLHLDCQLIDPVGYIEMTYLLKNCGLVMTDSGGLQKEAYFFNKYCLTLRKETEWTELIEHHYNHLVHMENIEQLNALTDQHFNQLIKYPKQLYGDGECSKRIATSIRRYFNGDK